MTSLRSAQREWRLSVSEGEGEGATARLIAELATEHTDL